MAAAFPAELKQEEKAEVEQALQKSDRLAKIYHMRQELAHIWERSSLTREQLVKSLQDWCQKAEASGIEALKEFSLKLRSYA